MSSVKTVRSTQNKLDRETEGRKFESGGGVRWSVSHWIRWVALAGFVRKIRWYTDRRFPSFLNVRWATSEGTFLFLMAGTSVNTRKNTTKLLRLYYTSARTSPYLLFQYVKNWDIAARTLRMILAADAVKQTHHWPQHDVVRYALMTSRKRRNVSSVSQTQPCNTDTLTITTSTCALLSTNFDKLIKIRNWDKSLEIYAAP